jgi:hypothetical protein
MQAPANVFRPVYRKLNKLEKQAMNSLKDKALTLYQDFETLMNPNNGREFSLAKTKLEESVMWAVKGLTK